MIGFKPRAMSAADGFLDFAELITQTRHLAGRRFHIFCGLAAELFIERGEYRIKIGGFVGAFTEQAFQFAE